MHGSRCPSTVGFSNFYKVRTGAWRPTQKLRIWACSKEYIFVLCHNYKCKNSYCHRLQVGNPHTQMKQKCEKGILRGTSICDIGALEIHTPKWNKTVKMGLSERQTYVILMRVFALVKVEVWVWRVYYYLLEFGNAFADPGRIWASYQTTMK